MLSRSFTACARGRVASLLSLGRGSAMAISSSATRSGPAAPTFTYQELFDTSTPNSPPAQYRKLTSEGVSTFEVILSDTSMYLSCIMTFTSCTQLSR